MQVGNEDDECLVTLFVLSMFDATVFLNVYGQFDEGVNKTVFQKLSFPGL